MLYIVVVSCLPNISMTERDENQYAKNCNDSDHNNEDNDYHIPRWWSDLMPTTLMTRYAVLFDEGEPLSTAEIFSILIFISFCH